MQIFFSRFRRTFVSLFIVTFIAVFAFAAIAQQQAVKRTHNAIIFVTDGLRPTSVNTLTAPTLATLRAKGVRFSNSHALFPTFTTANASAIATGHLLGDTGDFSNTIDVGFPITAAGGSRTPFLENNAVLGEVNSRFNGNYLGEESLLAAARAAGFSTAAIGKVGPVAIQDVTQRTGTPTIVVDDSTGSSTGLPLSSELSTLLTQNGLSLSTPSRGANGQSGTSTTPGTKVANTTQQQYFADVTTKAVLPLFKRRSKPFVLVFWSRDPDGTQHNQGDSLNQLTPGINGPTSKAAVLNADNNLAQIRQALRTLGLESTTDIFVTADHGFSTISKQTNTSYAASLTFQNVPKGFLPPGFLAIDLARGLGLPLYDPDNNNALVTPTQGQRPKNGDALIGQTAAQPDVVVAANGGSDLIYLPTANNKTIARRVVNILLAQDYISGIFVRDDLGPIGGTLPLSTINLVGTARTPTPAIAVSFRTFDTGCGTPTACAVEIADTGLQQGQGMHGTFARADTYNNMLAYGPDFKRGYTDVAPVSNADVAPTLARVLGLKLPSRGKLIGRVISEALVGGPSTVAFQSGFQQSAILNGLRTVVKYQTVGGVRYIDVAGFPGRTVGLPKNFQSTAAELPEATEADELALRSADLES